MKKDNKLSKLNYVSAIILYIVAVIYYFTRNVSMGTLFLSLGTLNIYIGKSNNSNTKKKSRYYMTLKYLNEKIPNENGIECQVLDINSVDFTNAVSGRKCKETLIFKAMPNEEIITRNSNGEIECTYVTKGNETVFVNSDTDIYVPRDKNGNPWNIEEIESHGYEIANNKEYIFNNHLYNGLIIKSNQIAKIFPNIIEIPTCIKDVWGEGAHQFLFKGATLKQDPVTKKVTGIDKEAFDKTWEQVDENTIKFK